ncbi:hypothetical protein V5O48_006759 [Marasmius crinis-equi]|uniref:Uncharacterized protein n=1 Tax=Marasmius crinis-equi TaxID=585013 RepID=A0ABR3FIZ9_9AGAR
MNVSKHTENTLDGSSSSDSETTPPPPARTPKESTSSQNQGKSSTSSSSSLIKPRTPSEKDKPLAELISEPFPSFDHQGSVVDPFGQEMSRDVNFEQELGAMLLDLILETHAWSSARPKHESQMAVQKLEQKITDVLETEKEQGMSESSMSLSSGSHSCSESISLRSSDSARSMMSTLIALHNADMQNFAQASPSSSTGPGFMQSIVSTGNLSQQSNPVANDPNSVETFKQNIQMILEYVMTTQSIARSALSGITNAYHSSSSSTQTQADLASLQQNLHLISDMMRHTGVGALPLLASPSSSVVGPTNDDVPMSQEPISPPTEDEMLAQANRSITVLYERLRKVQEAAGVVGSLLGSSGQPTQSQFHAMQGIMPGTPMGYGPSPKARAVSGNEGRGASQTR